MSLHVSLSLCLSVSPSLTNSPGHPSLSQRGPIPKSPPPPEPPSPSLHHAQIRHCDSTSEEGEFDLFILLLLFLLLFSCSLLSLRASTRPIVFPFFHTLITFSTIYICLSSLLSSILYSTRSYTPFTFLSLANFPPFFFTLAGHQGHL